MAQKVQEWGKIIASGWVMQPADESHASKEKKEHIKSQKKRKRMSGTHG
jgi:hypothetical protein